MEFVSMKPFLISIAMLMTAPLIAVEPSTELVSVNWQSLTALSALIIVLLFLIIKYLPDMNRSRDEQAKTFAELSKAQTLAATEATARHATESSKVFADTVTCINANTLKMHLEFINTLDKMADRYNKNIEVLNATMHAMHQTCPASATWVQSHGKAN